MNRLSEKVHFSGLTFLWLEITRIPNFPHNDDLLADVPVLFPRD
jgi:hypothetical protein